MKDVVGGTALGLASQTGNLEIDCQALLAAKADVNVRNSKGVTPLIVASSKGHPVVVRALLAVGAIVNAENIDGCTALVLASEHGYTDVVRVLLAGNANVNAAASQRHHTITRGSGKEPTKT